MKRLSLQQLHNNYLREFETEEYPVVTLIIKIDDFFKEYESAGCLLAILMAFILPKILILYILITLAIYYLRHHALHKFIEYESAINLINNLLSTKLDNFQYSKKSFIDKGILKRSKVFNNTITGYKGKNLIKGEYGGVEFIFSDLSIEYKDGRSTTTRNLSLLKFDLEEKLSEEIFVKEVIIKDKENNLDYSERDHKVLDKAINLTEKAFSYFNSLFGKYDIKIFNEELDKGLLISTDNPKIAEKVLTEELSKKLIKIKELYKDVSISIIRGRVFVALNYFNLTPSKVFFSRITFEEFCDMNKRLEIIIDILKIVSS